MAKGCCRVDFSSKIDVWVVKADVVVRMLAEAHLAKGRLRMLIRAHLVKAFCRLAFSTKSTLGSLRVFPLGSKDRDTASRS